MKHRLVIFDLDGTLYRGDQPTPGAVDTVATLREQGVLIRFLTNNSSKTRADLTAKLVDLGFEATEEEVFSSAIGTAALLKERVRWSFVVGETGIREALSVEGIQVVEAGEVASGPGAVVVGIDRGFTYEKMNHALQFLRDPATRFIATNTDATYPLEDGHIIPGAGSIVAGIATCAGRSPEVVGKPNPFLIEFILHQALVTPRDSLVVGDRMETDIDAGFAAGCDTHLVLCGVTAEPPLGQSSSADLRGILAL